jgi:hypothetical protein
MVTSAQRPAQRVVVDWNVSGLPADLATVDTLARCQLAARRDGYTLRLCNPAAELMDLILSLGLGDVLGSARQPPRP